MEERFVGSVNLESGRLLITDPCYLPDAPPDANGGLPRGLDPALIMLDVPRGAYPAYVTPTDEGELGKRVARLRLEVVLGFRHPSLARVECRVGVDSGQMSFSDPEVVLREWGGDVRGKEGLLEGFKPEEHRGQFDYQGACDVTLNGFGGELPPGKMVVSQTGFGDGEYPVLVERDPAGNVLSVTVEFIGDEGAA